MLNVCRLTGEINDGVEPNFDRGEWRQILTNRQSTIRQRLPQGQHKKDKQQQRAVRWRKKQHYRRQGKEIRKATKNMQKFKHKLGPTNEELNDRIDKNLLNMKKGARKKRRHESARIYREESATEKQRWTVSLQIGPGAVMDTWTLRDQMESSEYYGRTTTAYRS